MPKKQADLSFAPLALATSNSMVPYAMSGFTGELTKTQEQMMTDKDNQLFAIAGALEKAQAAVMSIHTMHRTAQMEMYATAQNVGALNAAVHGTNYQVYVEQFNHYDIQLAAQHTYAVEDAAAHNIRREVERQLYKEEPKKRGFFGR
jgi:hypothetical protein